MIDLGSGGGIDVLLAAKKVGPKGNAIGVDMTKVRIFSPLPEPAHDTRQITDWSRSLEHARTSTEERRTSRHFQYLLRGELNHLHPPPRLHGQLHHQ